MLEAFFSKWIMHYLKEYLKELSPDQLELEVLQGKMKIKNLQLSPTALTIHHIPFLIRKGCIKLVYVVFPWNNLKNAATEITIEDIFITLQFESEILLKSDIQADQKSIHLKSDPETREDQVKIVQGLFESVIDNLRVQITNVHLRIEFPCEPKPIIIGFYTPEITFNTVDEKGEVINSIEHPLFVRKQLLIKKFSIFFDTDQEQIKIKDDLQFASSEKSIQSFIQTMMESMERSHQYIFKPTDFESLLIHTKDKKQKITNQVETKIGEISLNLDLQQCRSIINLNNIWSQFMKRRKYTSCLRPRSFNHPKETWEFAHKCAVLKNKPLVFKPYLALAILKNRIKYVELFKQAKVSKLSAALLGSPKQKLEALELKIGRTPSIFLREYAEAVFVKEESMKDHPDVTAYDISELKTIFETTELVLSMHQFSASISIDSFRLELLYEKDKPFVSLSCVKLLGGLSTIENAIKMSINAKDASVFSYVNNSSKHLFYRIDKDENNDFIILNLTVPYNDVVSSFDCILAPIKVTIDSETVVYIFDFFKIPKTQQLNSSNDKIARFEIGEILQPLKKLSNYKMSVKMSRISYDFPFKCENDEIKYLTFEMADFNFIKNLDKISQKNDAKIPMDFVCSLNLVANIDKFTLFKTEDIKANLNFLFTNGKLNVDINSKVDLSTFQIFVPKECLKVISYAVNGIIALPFVKSVSKEKTPSNILIVGRSKVNFDIELKTLFVYLNDDIKENEMQFIIGDLTGSINYYLTSFKYSAILKNMKITQFNKNFVEILNQINFDLNKKIDNDCVTIESNVSKPHVYLDFRTILWLIDFAKQFQNAIPQEEQIQLNEPIQKVNPDVPLYPEFKSVKSDETMLNKNYLPSSMLLTNSFLTESIEDFLSNSNLFKDKSSNFFFDGEEKNSSGSDDDDDILVPKDKEEVKPLNIDLKLNVDGVWMEMIDRSEKKINSYFKIGSLSIIDFSPTSYKIRFKDFVVSRQDRIIFLINDFVVPYTLPDPIKIEVDYAESHIFSEDIISLSYDSPTIFKILFGGETPLFKDTIVINAVAKKGFGSLRKENNEPISFVNVSNVRVGISLGPKELKVDARLRHCDGYYKDDRHQFMDLFGEFHCNYIGTMDDQKILVEIPSAKLSLKKVFAPWFSVFESIIPADDVVLQPLKIDISVEPCQIDFLMDESDEEFEVKTSGMLDYGPKENCIKSYSLLLDKSSCKAFRNDKKEVDLELNLDEVKILSDINETPIFKMKYTHFVKNNFLLTLIISSIDINFPISFLSHLSKDIFVLIPQKQLSILNKLFLPRFGVDVEIENCTISIYPTPKSALRLNLPSVNFIFNSSHQIAFLDIESIKVYTISVPDEPVLSIDLPKIKSILSFNEKTKLDLSSITFESIQKLENKRSEKQPIRNVFLDYKMDLIQINYTHYLAKISICSVFDMMIGIQQLPIIQLIPKGLFSNLKISINCFIGKIKINFIIIDPFASLSFEKIKLIYDGNYNASISDFSLQRIYKNHDILKSLITKKNEKEDFISIAFKNDEIYVFLNENDLFVDLELLFSLTKFIMASPFLKIRSILAQIKKSKEHKMNFVTFSKALPFDLILNIKETDISIPISLEKNNIHQLQLHISSLISLTSSNISLNLSSLKLNFYDIDSRIIFPSFLSNFTADFSIDIEEDYSLSLRLNILDFNLEFSARDIYFLILLGQSIKEALNSQIFVYEESNIDLFHLKISSIELITSKMTFVLCKDTRSFSSIVPIYRCIIPEIIFKVQKTNEKEISKSPVIISIKPYVEYFNIVTGNFDLIIEPINMHLYAYIISEQMKFGVNVTDDININFPLDAIMKMKDLIEEITRSLKNKKTMEYGNLPSMWLCNKLGSTVIFTVGENEYSLSHDDYSPLFDSLPSDTISFSVDDKDYSIEPNSFNYPTYLSRLILAVKKPYRGGMMISFERTYQIENNLSFSLDVYICESENKEFQFVSSIPPHGRIPLIFDNETYITFCKKGESENIKSNILRLYLLDKSISIFKILFGKNKAIQCTKTVFNDTKIAARIISINSQYLIYNLLPSTLYIKNDNDVFSVKRGETTDFYFVDDDIISAFLSLDDKTFLEKKSHAKVEYKKATSINIYNPETKSKQKCMIEFDYEKDIFQTTIIIYMPVVLFNKTLFELDFKFLCSKDESNDSNKNYMNSFKVLPNSSFYWCSLSLIDTQDDESLMITAFINGKTKIESKPFDCMTTGRNTLYMTSLTNDSLFVPLCCNIFNQCRTSVLTIAPFVTIVNNLKIDFLLTPTRDLEADSEILCQPFIFSPCLEIMIPYISESGSAAFSIKEYTKSVPINIIEPQKTVFKIYDKLFELNVIDKETGIVAEFNEVHFPTPILINNQLDVAITAFQSVSSSPFKILPQSTSIFAFDEPFSYPYVTITYDPNNVYRISLVEETEKIKLKRKLNDKPVYAQVKHNKYGNKLVIITQEEEEPNEENKFVFELSINGIAASLIDYQIRETALVYLSKLNSKIAFNSEYLVVSATLDSFQVDDQNPLAPNPTVIYCFSTDNKPYISFNCLCPICCKSFTSFDYFSLNIQRMDIDANSSFVSDWLNFIGSLKFKIVHSIKPKKPLNCNQTKIIALRYFEVTPALMILNYNRSTKRPPMLDKIPRFLKFVPNIKEKKMILPGFFLSRITDRIDSIKTNLVNDYKTEAFNSIFGMLGSAGKFLKILGIASAIASSLNINMTSDMTTKISINSIDTIQFSNQISSSYCPIIESKTDLEALKVPKFESGGQFNRCFSPESLSPLLKKIDDNSMSVSPLITFIMPKFKEIDETCKKVLYSIDDEKHIKKKLDELQKEKNKVIDQVGLHLKMIRGISYRKGIECVLTKELNEELAKANPSFKRIRETRPYAGAKISNFRPEIANAQKIIFQNGGMNEKAKEISVSKDGESKIFIIMTENTLYVFSGDLTRIIKSVNFSDILKVHIDDNNLIKLKLKDNKVFIVTINSKISLNFLLSMLRMNHRFKDSLLL